MSARTVRVADVLELKRREVPIDPLGEYRLIGVYSFGKGIFHRDPVPGSDLGDYRFFAVEPGDLVLSNIQAWEGAIGHAMARDAGTVGTHRFLTYVSADVDLIDTNWARYFFLSDPGFALIQRAAPGSITRNRTLSIDRFEALEIPLPDIEEQRLIASNLDAIAERSTTISEHVAAATKLAAALPASLAQRNDLNEIEKRQQGWLSLPLGEVMTEVEDMVTVEPTESYSNVGVLSFGRGLFEKPPIDGPTTSAKKLNRIGAGQFMYSRLFAFEGAYAAVPPRFDGYFVSGEFPTFEVDAKRLLAPYLAAYLKSDQNWAELAGSSKGLGVRRQRIHAESLLAYKVWLPPLAYQRQVVLQLERLDQAAQLRERSSARVAALEASALNQAFAGLL